ncbi:dihydrofolate reductase [Actinotalea sp. M2MS4P-6]|uniref:dihydrofolate reductase n=1 Tax=Actinotalea sp. M2MS4P-6 TaxID=2983762 RepID=UPI0021E3AA0E|nr:dihydrofolate reductase [Actinotalea sp. M2MS4P-6]MCV2396137.1 dihydrofolate reductase [Actinotalea sp. M2MS4P-6]
MTGPDDARPAPRGQHATVPGLGLVWAQSTDGVIGVDGDLPWHLPEDLAHFRQVTDRCVVLMGRTTWESLPARFRPLPGRVSVVLSRAPGLRLPGAVVVPGPAQALELVADAGRPVWVVGGGQVYAAFEPHADRAELTEVEVTVGTGTRAPDLAGRRGGWHTVARDPEEGWLSSTSGLRYRFVTLSRTASGPTPAGE